MRQLTQLTTQVVRFMTLSIAVNKEICMRILKRYKNRKIYDTTNSKYINLVQVFDIFENEPLMVQDLEGNEITLSVLYDAINAKKPAPQDAIRALNKMKDKGFVF